MLMSLVCSVTDVLGPYKLTANTSLKFAPFGRRTPQKRGASYLGR